MKKVHIIHDDLFRHVIRGPREIRIPIYSSASDQMAAGCARSGGVVMIPYFVALASTADFRVARTRILFMTRSPLILNGLQSKAPTMLKPRALNSVWCSSARPRLPTDQRGAPFVGQPREALMVAMRLAAASLRHAATPNSAKIGKVPAPESVHVARFSERRRR